MFSVIIPTYNNEDTITEAINSVLNQSAYNLIEEILVIDDGSTDNTRYVVKKFEKNNNKIRYIYKENGGAASARNLGIKEAKADWIALLDGDDIWLPNKIERQWEVLNKNKNIVFLGSQYPLKILLKEYHGLVKLTAKQLCIRSMPYTPSVVFKKNVGEKYGFFNESMQYCEDSNFFQKFLLEDSYYVLAEDLIKIDIGKSYFGEKGLSSHFHEMYDGKIANMKEMYNYGLINKLWLDGMIILCKIKEVRRIIQRKVHSIK